MTELLLKYTLVQKIIKRPNYMQNPIFDVKKIVYLALSTKSNIEIILSLAFSKFEQSEQKDNYWLSKHLQICWFVESESLHIIFYTVWLC